MEQSKGWNAIGYIIVFSIIGLVLAFVVAFFHDLFTGQRQMCIRDRLENRD